MSKYEQRLENQILRLMRELRQLRAHREKEGPTATSEFAEIAVEYYQDLVRRRLQEQKDLDEESAPAPSNPVFDSEAQTRRGEGRGEGPSSCRRSSDERAKTLSPSLAQSTGRGSQSDARPDPDARPNPDARRNPNNFAQRDTSKMKNEATESPEATEEYDSASGREHGFEGPEDGSGGLREESEWRPP
jgi:hypothetical protein